MRILFHAPPLHGHTSPLMPLASALRAQGHHVAWAAGADTQSLLARQGFEWHAVGPDRNWAMAELRRQWPESTTLPPAQVVAEMGPRLFGGVYAPATLPDLLALISQWRPDLVVHDVWAHAAPLGAAVAGLPSVSHGFGLPRPGALIAQTHARTERLWQQHKLEQPPDSGNHRQGHVDICPPSLRLEEQPLPSGPRWLLSPTPGVKRCQGPRRGVLASFGTVHHRQASFERLLNVLRSGPWPARAALGRPMDPSQIWPAHVHAAAWLDLADEWTRCRVGACHGGAGTMLGALAQGVPLLLLPVAADQFRNARALCAVAAGISLEREAQTEAGIRVALQRLHDDSSHAQAALRMADEMAGMPQADAVARALVQSLGCRGQ